jgi:proteic killer suppression protein
MIQSVNHNWLQLLWETRKQQQAARRSDQISRIERMLDIIDSAQQMPEDFGAYQNWDIHKLSGELKDYWSVKVNKNYRIIFRFDRQHAYDLDR